eukprot:m.1006483 g.1006483  ORF g.1006483 m.1006483 type:complete len:923 (-) comp24055_c0_seq8:189-2957(-)
MAASTKNGADKSASSSNEGMENQPKLHDETNPRKFINKFKESKFYSKPRVTATAEPSVDDMISIALDGGPQFLRDAVAKAKRTLLGDSKKKKLPAAQQQQSRSGRRHPLVPNVVHWTITLRFPLSLSVDPGIRLGLEGKTVVVLHVNKEVLPHKADIEVGDEVIEINRQPAADIVEDFHMLTGDVVLRLALPPSDTESDLRLRKLVTQDQDDLYASVLQKPHDVLILNLCDDENGKEGGSDEADDDIVYQYSHAPWVQEETEHSLLYRLRGALLTLHAQMKEVLTLDAPTSATLEYAGDTVHVVYRQITRRHVIIVATSDSIATHTILESVLTSTLRILATTIGPLETAFSTPLSTTTPPVVEDDAAGGQTCPNTDEGVGGVSQSFLHTFFHAFFNRLSSVSDATLVRSAFAGAPSLVSPGPLLDATLALEVSDILDLLETKGVNVALGHPDLWVAVGACMFFAGALVQSRLGATDLTAVEGVCRVLSLLDAPLPLHAGLHVTAYRRIHECMCMRVRGAGTSASSSDAEGYVLITALDHAVLCLLVKCWRRPDLHTPDIVRAQMRDAELRLHMLKVNGTTMRIKNLVDRVGLPTVLHNDHDYAVAAREASSADEQGGGNSSTGATSDDGRVRSRYDSTGRRRPLKSRVSFTKRKRVAEVFEQPRELIHFLELDWLTGIAVCSLGTKTLVGTSVCPAVLRNFYSACGRIREVLLAPRTTTAQFGASDVALGEVLEHGILFSTAGSDPEPTAQGQATQTLSGGLDNQRRGTGPSTGRHRRTASGSMSRKHGDAAIRRSTDPGGVRSAGGSFKGPVASRSESGGDSGGHPITLQRSASTLHRARETRHAASGINIRAPQHTHRRSLSDGAVAAVAEPAVTHYWVVGRLLVSGPCEDAAHTEFYVCFEDGTPANTVELAFRLHRRV